MPVISAHFQRCPAPITPRAITGTFKIAPENQQEVEDVIVAIYEQFTEQLRYAQYLNA